MRGSRSRFCRIMSLFLAVSVAAVWPAWPQQTQSAPAAPPQATGKEAPQQQPPAPVPAPQTSPQKPPQEDEAKESPAPRVGATLKGRVLGADHRTPIPAAMVHAVAADGKVVSSLPADAKGNYVLQGLAPGAYTLAVSAQGGVFSLESQVGVTSAKTFRVDLAVVQADGASFVVPGLALGPRGFCYIIQGRKPEATTYWRSPKGMILLGATAAAAGMIVAGSGGDDEKEPVSPSAP